MLNVLFNPKWVSRVLLLPSLRPTKKVPPKDLLTELEIRILWTEGVK